MKKLVINGNEVYEVDLECVRQKKNIEKCKLKIRDNIDEKKSNLKK